MRQSSRAEARLKQLYKELEQAERMALVHEGSEKEHYKHLIDCIKDAIVEIIRNLM